MDASCCDWPTFPFKLLVIWTYCNDSPLGQKTNSSLVIAQPFKLLLRGPSVDLYGCLSIVAENKQKSYGWSWYQPFLNITVKNVTRIVSLYLQIHCIFKYILWGFVVKSHWTIASFSLLQKDACIEFAISCLSISPGENWPNWGFFVESGVCFIVPAAFVFSLGSPMLWFSFWWELDSHWKLASPLRSWVSAASTQPKASKTLQRCELRFEKIASLFIDVMQNLWEKIWFTGPLTEMWNTLYFFEDLTPNSSNVYGLS